MTEYALRGEREREQFVENIHRHLGLNILGPLSQREGKMSVSVFKISVDTQTLTIFRSANGRRGRDIIDRRYLANITLTNTAPTQYPGHRSLLIQVTSNYIAPPPPHINIIKHLNIINNKMQHKGILI